VIPLLLGLSILGLTACGVRDAIPQDADHPLLWFVGLSAGMFLLSGALAMTDHVFRAHSRRDARRDRRDERRSDEED
jgi:hypothetical protein